MGSFFTHSKRMLFWEWIIFIESWRRMDKQSLIRREVLFYGEGMYVATEASSFRWLQDWHCLFQIIIACSFEGLHHTNTRWGIGHSWGGWSANAQNFFPSAIDNIGVRVQHYLGGAAWVLSYTAFSHPHCTYPLQLLQMPVDVLDRKGASVIVMVRKEARKFLYNERCTQHN